MMKRLGAAIFAAMTLGAVAHAETGTFTVFGMGAYSCGEFIAASGNHAPGYSQVMDSGSGRLLSENSTYLQWLAGFVTAFNEARGGELEQQINGIDLAGLDLWMRNWCNQHPTKTIFDGASAFINEMRGGSTLTERSPLVSQIPSASQVAPGSQIAPVDSPTPANSNLVRWLKGAASNQLARTDQINS
jgi:hypothetical protein